MDDYLSFFFILKGDEVVTPLGAVAGENFIAFVK